jgi:hypothetical protein
MKEIANIIRSVCEEYRPNGMTDVELCAWVRDRTFECISSHPTGGLTRSVRYQEAYIDFIGAKKMFCIYKTDKEGVCMDVCIPLNAYITKEFGIPLTEDFIWNIDLSYIDLMHMAETITDEICVWVPRLEDIGAEI